MKCHLRGERSLDEALAMFRELIDRYRAIGITHLMNMTLYHLPGVYDAEQDKIKPVTHIGRDRIQEFTIKNPPYPCAADEVDEREEWLRQVMDKP
jgi:hypothetical protein